MWIMDYSTTYTWILFILLLQGVLCVEILSVDVPSHIQVGHTAILMCQYELGNDELYSVKWYKGKDEFYRYVPKDTPPGQVFKLNGVKVNQTASNNHQLVLANVVIATSGKYRCEVSAEAPSFQTVSQSKEMLVINPPDEGPTISGGQSKYRIGDPVRVNCSTIRSSPAATLEWYINGKKAVDGALHTYPPIIDRDGLESSILGLQFQVSDQHFENGNLHLRCVARIRPLFTMVSNHFIKSEHLLSAPIMESKNSLSQVLNNRSSKYPGSHQFFIVFSLLPFVLLR